MKIQSSIRDYFKPKVYKKQPNVYKKQTKITDYYKLKKIYGYNDKTDEWHCTLCGISMGKDNPRQLCGKIICYNY